MDVYLRGIDQDVKVFNYNSNNITLNCSETFTMIWQFMQKIFYGLDGRKKTLKNVWIVV